MAQAKVTHPGNEIGVFSLPKKFKTDGLGISEAQCNVLETLSLNGAIKAKFLLQRSRMHKNSRLWTKLKDQLQHMPKLKQLKLCDNQISDYTQDEILGLTSVLRSCTNLLTVELSGNAILTMPHIRFQSFVDALATLPFVAELIDHDQYTAAQQKSPDYLQNVQYMQKCLQEHLIKNKLVRNHFQRFCDAVKETPIENLDDAILVDLYQAYHVQPQNTEVKGHFDQAQRSLSDACATAFESGNFETALKLMDKLLLITHADKKEFVLSKRAIIEKHCKNENQVCTL